VSHPSAFSFDEDADWLREDAFITLLYGELFLDRWLQTETGSVCNCSEYPLAEINSVLKELHID
jgi:hypothetical protein